MMRKHDLRRKLLLLHFGLLLLLRFSAFAERCFGVLFVMN